MGFRWPGRTTDAGFPSPSGHLIRGDLQLPAQDKPLQYLGRVRRWVGAEQGLGIEGTFGISDEHPTDGDGWLARAVPNGGLGGEFHGTGSAVIPGNRGDGPRQVALVKDSFRGWSPRAFQRRPAILTRLPWWRWLVQGSVQAQSGNQSNRLTEGLAAAMEVEDGVAIVLHQHQRAMGQPAWFGRLTMSGLQDHLPRPVGDLLVPTALPLVVARGGRQHGEHRQGPMPSGPGDTAQPHQGDPAQTTGLDQLWRLERTASR